MKNVNAALSAGSVNDFVLRNVKIDNTDKLAIDDLFYLYDAEREGHKPFYHEVFTNYYQSLSSKNKLNLRSLFDCINRNQVFKSEFRYHKMKFSLYDPELKESLDFKLPHNNFFKYFFMAYTNSLISCDVIFDEILTFLNEQNTIN